MELNNVSDELLFRIFGFLPLKDRFVLQRVCKLWSSVPFYDVKRIVFVGSFESIATRGLYAAVSASECNALLVHSWANVVAVLKECHRIKCVSFFQCNFEDTEQINELGTFIKNVEALHLNFTDKAISEEELIELTKHTSRIHEFTFNFNGCLSRETLHYVFTQNPGLKQLTVSQFPYISPINQTMLTLPLSKLSITAVTSDSCFDLLQRLCSTSEQTLESLSLPDIEGVNELELISRFKNLKELRVTIRYLPANWNTYFTGFEKLEILKLQVYPGFDWKLLLPVVRQNVKLKVLDLSEFISSIEDLFVLNLSLLCKNLQCFMLSNPVNITGDSLAYLLSLPNLEMLQLHSEAKISQRSICWFIEKAKSLRVLCFYGFKAADVFAEKAAEYQNRHRSFFGYFANESVPYCLPINVRIFNRNVDRTIWMYYFELDYYKIFNEDYFAYKRISLH